MNGDQAKKLNGNITKHTSVSIGLILALAGVVWFFASSNATIQAEVGNIKNDYMPRGELNQRLLNIEDDVEETKDAVVELRNYLIK